MLKDKIAFVSSLIGLAAAIVWIVLSFTGADAAARSPFLSIGLVGIWYGVGRLDGAKGASRDRR